MNDTRTLNINMYTCRKCRKKIVTTDLVEGTTPLIIGCNDATGSGCKGDMQSSFYDVSQSLEPEYEWFKPTDFSVYSSADRTLMEQHVKQGGLDLRKIEK